MKITVEHQLERQKLDSLGGSSWPVWEQEASEYSWHHDDRESCYLLEGEVEVTPMAVIRRDILVEITGLHRIHLMHMLKNESIVSSR